MSGFYGIDSNREVIRVHAKQCDGQMQPKLKKFSIDPVITSFEMLQSLIAKAFDIKSDFTISYLSCDSRDNGYLIMLSDWDMDAAFENSSDPYLQLKMELKPFDVDVLEDWDVIVPADIPQNKMPVPHRGGTFLGNITGSISSGVGKTVSRLQQVIGLKIENYEMYQPKKNAMTDVEFRNYQDSDGHIIKSEELRLSIYLGGIEHSLRQVVWCHLLNIFPKDLSEKERIYYMKKKEQEYIELRERWQAFFNTKQVSEEAKQVALLIKKDVLRTDRSHKYFSGTHDYKHLDALYNLLVTYALTHPEISYCQGMSDIASPLLVVQNDEAQAYLCFCGLMARLRSNFMYDGKAITTKLQHLSLLVHFYDPVFHKYLQDCGADNLFFCYRWLLLEMKREFPFEDALYMLEVMWSTIPPCLPEQELHLADVDFSPGFLSISPHTPLFTLKQNQYARLLARHKISASGACKDPSISKSIQMSPTQRVSEQVINELSSSTEAEDKHVSPCVVIEDTSNKKSGGEVDFEHRTLLGSCNAIDGNIGSYTQNPSQTVDVEKFPTVISASIEGNITIIDDEMGISFEEISTDIDPVSNTDGTITKTDCATVNQSCLELNHEMNGICTNHFSEPENTSDNQSQFHMSLEETDVASLKRNETHLPQIKGSFFNNMKNILTAPQRKLGGRQRQMQTTNNILNLKHDVKNKTLFVQKDVTNLNFMKKDNAEHQRNNGHDTDGEHTLFEINGTMKKLFVADKEIVENDSRADALVSLLNHTQDPKIECSTQVYRKSSVSKPIDIHTQEDEQCVNENYKEVTKENENYKEVKKEIPHENLKVLKDCDKAPSFCDNYYSINDDLPPNDDKSQELSVKEDEVGDCVEALDPDIMKLAQFKQLPSPDEFGYGNPFLMFICLTILLQHHNVIVNKGMEYDELAMYFSKMVRKHKVNKVLHQARLWYTEYIQMQKRLSFHDDDDDDEDETDFKV